MLEKKYHNVLVKQTSEWLSLYNETQKDFIASLSTKNARRLALDILNNMDNVFMYKFNPIDGAINVDVWSTISVTFNKEIVPGSFVFTLESDAWIVSWVWTQDVTWMIYSFVPWADLSHDKKYIITISAVNTEWESVLETSAFTTEVAFSS